MQAFLLLHMPMADPTSQLHAASAPHSDALTQAVVATPSVVVVIWTQIAGLTLPQWAAAVAIVSGLFHLGYLIWKWRNETDDRVRMMRREHREHPELFETTDKAEL